MKIGRVAILITALASVMVFSLTGCGGGGTTGDTGTTVASTTTTTSTGGGGGGSTTSTTANGSSSTTITSTTTSTTTTTLIEGSISGTVSLGSALWDWGTLTVWVSTSQDFSSPDIYSTRVRTGETSAWYTSLHNPVGTYYLCAFLSLHSPDQIDYPVAGDPIGRYSDGYKPGSPSGTGHPIAVSVPSSAPVTGINWLLNDNY